METKTVKNVAKIDNVQQNKMKSVKRKLNQICKTLVYINLSDDLSAAGRTR